MSRQPVPGTDAYEVWRRAPVEAARAQEEAKQAEAVRNAASNAPDIVRRRHSATRILAEIKATTAFDADMLLRHDRPHEIVLIRQEVFYRLRAEAHLSIREIARRMNRTSATVIHGIRAHARRNGLPDLRSVSPSMPPQPVSTASKP